MWIVIWRAANGRFQFDRARLMVTMIRVLVAIPSRHAAPLYPPPTTRVFVSCDFGGKSYHIWISAVNIPVSFVPTINAIDVCDAALWVHSDATDKHDTVICSGVHLQFHKHKTFIREACTDEINHGNVCTTLIWGFAFVNGNMCGWESRTRWLAIGDVKLRRIRPVTVECVLDRLHLKQ